MTRTRSAGIPAWSRNVSRRAVGTPKLAFTDSGIAANLLGADARSLLRPGGRFVAATAGRTRGTEEFGQFLADRFARVAGAYVPDAFDERRLGIDDVHDLADGAGFDVEDAFVVERAVLFRADEYARWWVASGPPWPADQVPPADAIELITRALGGFRTPVTVLHASVVMLLRRSSPGQLTDA